MSLPKLNIVIPTLQRPDTLYWTLKTVLEQDYKNFQVLVSDNFSNDNTPDIVASFNDPRVQYIKTDRKLSMSHHWEFALAHISDGYVTVLGDDDGFLPGSLSKVAGIIQTYQPQAIGWRFANFNWHGLPPYFMIPMGATYRLINSSEEAKKIFQNSIYATIQFPSLYGGFIKKELVDSLKQKYNGKFFHSRIPDFFSGAIVAANIEEYIRIDYPVTINATSKHSTGFATVSNNTTQNAFNDLRKNDDSNIPFHPSLVFIRSNAVPIAEAMLQVNSLEPDFPLANIKNVLCEAANEASVCDNKAKYVEMIKGIKEMGKINDFEAFTNEIIKQHPYKPATLKPINKYSPISNTLYIDTTTSRINTVYDACKIASLFVPANIHFSSSAKPSKLESLKGFLRVQKGKKSKIYKEYFK